MIFANKQDVTGSLSSAEIREVCRSITLKLLAKVEGGGQALDLDSIKSHRWRIQPCSAVTGAHLVDGLDWVVKDVAERCVLFPPDASDERKV